MKELIISGKTTFRLDAPYKLYETGAKGDKPLIVYVHGFGQTIATFENKVKKMMQVKAYHLFLQAPYPIYDRSRSKKVEDWGRAWYLYDGEQDQFVKSLEQASEFIQESIHKLVGRLALTRTAVLGYSMGGYLAGYYALSRKDYVNDLIVIGGRVKSEVFETRDHQFDHLNVLALHGSDDTNVEYGPQQKSVRQLQKWGANVEFQLLDETHALSEPYIDRCIDWLKGIGYHLL